MSPALLSVDALGVSFDRPDGTSLAAITDVSLAVHAGRTLAVVGESGCGKSVTALSLLGLLPRPPARIESGRAIFHADDGRTMDLLTLSPRELRTVRGRRIAMIFQEPMSSLNPVLTIGEQVVEAVCLHQKRSRRDARQEAERALGEVGIADAASRLDAYPHEFSGGMRQRVMIAMALACRPSVLLADEPTTALDATVQAQILDLIRGLQASRGLGVMLITHSMGVVARVADDVCVMYAGRVVEYADVRTIFERPRHPYTRALIACSPSLESDVDHRRRPLVSIDSLLSDPGKFAPLTPEGVASEVRGLMVPWWPTNSRPAHIPGDIAPSRAARLARIGPGHWAAVWSDPRSPQPPDPSPGQVTSSANPMPIRA
jgi:peptide/nickel transport system ATP-binding protein